jgi:hypothetical protein
VFAEVREEIIFKIDFFFIKQMNKVLISNAPHSFRDKLIFNRMLIMDFRESNKVWKLPKRMSEREHSNEQAHNMYVR